MNEDRMIRFWFLFYYIKKGAAKNNIRGTESFQRHFNYLISRYVGQVGMGVDCTFRWRWNEKQRILKTKIKTIVKIFHQKGGVNNEVWK